MKIFLPWIPNSLNYPDDFPDLAKSAWEMAHADIEGYHNGRKAFDDNFMNSVYSALDVLKVEVLKAIYPGKSVVTPDWKAGFVHKLSTDFNPLLDAERLILQRREYRNCGQYAEADAVRVKMESFGYAIKDAVNGTSGFRHGPKSRYYPRQGFVQTRLRYDRRGASAVAKRVYTVME